MSVGAAEIDGRAPVVRCHSFLALYGPQIAVRKGYFIAFTIGRNESYFRGSLRQN